eukprot:CAMPEP_0194766748 /NCGR_PEP_ID=MMETSP0323_2-20130528/32838_1 /TAXON_ID=2866 ORGANISM="Crypthecodinium cohnii, Strain Seligo" /NCGR_SAMPLE_ID=MMETSP0323_2 /ASSEMBLY_ACC=CAM_ASM_000346 /LENGTH=60 /DNA_ID=CAMNT_0039697917 /DNA_START=249 /DNA_END=428 /DNA_ORIENTATION=+
MVVCEKPPLRDQSESTKGSHQSQLRMGILTPVSDIRGPPTTEWAPAKQTCSPIGTAGPRE